MLCSVNDRFKLKVAIIGLFRLKGLAVTFAANKAVALRCNFVVVTMLTARAKLFYNLKFKRFHHGQNGGGLSVLIKC